jgi:predicted N-acetyltransferase YhbS
VKDLRNCLRDKFNLNEDLYIISIEDFCSCLSEKNWCKIRAFNCGNSSMENYLKQAAYYDSIEFKGNTSLVVNEKDEVVAYFTLVQSDMKFPSKPIPCLEIARIAVRSDYQKNGVGSYLISKIKKMATQTNHRFLTVDAIKAKFDWYKKQEFLPFKTEEITDAKSPCVYMYCDLYNEEFVECFLDE